MRETQLTVVILAGGLPSTLDIEEKIPKPMAEIGGRPILWHIMKQFSHYGFHDFIICAGYRKDIIKEYFLNYYIYQSDITVDLNSNEVTIHQKQTEDWNVTIMDTGRDTPSVGRILKLQDILYGKDFIVTYGDCVSDIDIRKLVKQFYHSSKQATMVLTKPTGRYRQFSMYGQTVTDCEQETGWINANIMAYRGEIYSYVQEQGLTMQDSLEESLLKNNEMDAYCHKGFWSAIETKREQVYLDRLWNEGKAPWKVWES